MDGVDKMILSLSHLKEGHYLFKLTVYDSKGLTGTDTVSVNVKRGKLTIKTVPTDSFR